MLGEELVCEDSGVPWPAPRYGHAAAEDAVFLIQLRRNGCLAAVRVVRACARGRRGMRDGFGSAPTWGFRRGTCGIANKEVVVELILETSF